MLTSRDSRRRRGQKRTACTRPPSGRTWACRRSSRTPGRTAVPWCPLGSGSTYHRGAKTRPRVVDPFATPGRGGWQAGEEGLWTGWGNNMRKSRKKNPKKTTWEKTARWVTWAKACSLGELWGFIEKRIAKPLLSNCLIVYWLLYIILWIRLKCSN